MKIENPDRTRLLHFDGNNPSVNILIEKHPYKVKVDFFYNVSPIEVIYTMRKYGGNRYEVFKRNKGTSDDMLKEINEIMNK